MLLKWRIRKLRNRGICPSMNDSASLNFFFHAKLFFIDSDSEISQNSFNCVNYNCVQLFENGESYRLIRNHVFFLMSSQYRNSKLIQKFEDLTRDLLIMKVGVDIVEQFSTCRSVRIAVVSEQVQK